MSWLYMIALILYIIFGIPFAVTFLIYRIRCLDVHKCSNKKCIFRKCCDKYYEPLKQDEIEALIKMLDSID